MKKKTKSKKGMMATKLDMANAFERMKWLFIKVSCKLQASGVLPKSTLMLVDLKIASLVVVTREKIKCSLV